jgi:NAD(P)H-flavin reductase
LIVVRGNRQDVYLPYSIASAYDPQHPGEFELAAAYGAGADVMDALALGATLECEGPFGDFVWQPEPSAAALFVGVGTGVAPLRALIEEELLRPTQTRLLLIAGHRAPEDVLFDADFRALAETHVRFRFLPTLTLPSKSWLGDRGRVQAQLTAAAQALGIFDAYVCGRVDMVTEVVFELTRIGVAPDRIRSEGF